MKRKKLYAIALSVCLGMGLLTGCGGQNQEGSEKPDTSAASATSSAAASEQSEEKKTLVIGDTTFNASNEEYDVNPHNAYSGWACIRYGVGETLIKYSDEMEVQPWLATEWENVDELTWKITLRDGVKFSSGRDMMLRRLSSAWSICWRYTTVRKMTQRSIPWKRTGRCLRLRPLSRNRLC